MSVLSPSRPTGPAAPGSAAAFPSAPGDSLRLQVTGMHCASCAGRAERALAAVPGVRGVRVLLAQDAAEVELAPAAAGSGPGAGPSPGAAAPGLVAALEGARLGVRQEESVLALDGMSCASCVGRVRAALLAVPGVLGAEVNLATGEVRVERLAGTAPDAALASVLTGAGYAARPRSAPCGDGAAESGLPGEAERAAAISALARRAGWAAALCLPVFVMEMGGHLFPAFHHWMMGLAPHSVLWGVQFVLTGLILAGPGREFFARGIPLLLRGAPDMNALVALGTGAAFGFSSVALFAPGLLPEAAVAVYFEAAAVIATLVLAGRWLEARARGRAGAAIEALMRLAPAEARVEREGEVRLLPVSAILPGDRLHLRPGERVAVDGVVLSGESHADESMLTGEPMPVAKGAGDPVSAGTVNGAGALVVEARRVGADTALAQILRMVERAQATRLPIQSLLDRVVAVFVPVVMAVAVLAVALWLWLGPEPALGMALVAGVSVLIIACPCAMGLATPVSIMVGTGRAAAMGVLFRRGEALQRLEEVRLVAFDKTGTLTEGRPELMDVVTLPEGPEADALLRLAAAAEAPSEHPVAGALLRAAAGRGLDLPQAEGFRARAGFGLEARVEGRSVLVGAARLLQGEQIDTAPLAEAAARAEAEGRMAIHVALDGRIAGLLVVADRIRPEAAEALAALRGRGLRTALVSGDSAGASHAVARALGIDEVVAEVLPAGKVEALSRLRAAHGPVAFVGDGINDAPALAEADVGIAIGTGTDVAIEAADVVLVSGDPRGVENALHAARSTLRNVRQNLFWAFAYNTALIPVAAGLLYPALGVLLSPMLAAGAMALSSLFVLGNALRLRGLGPLGGAPGRAGEAA